MNTLKILYHLTIITILVFIAGIIYITIYTEDGTNRVVFIYENMKDAELEYYDN